MQKRLIIRRLYSKVLQVMDLPYVIWRRTHWKRFHNLHVDSLLLAIISMINEFTSRNWHVFGSSKGPERRKLCRFCRGYQLADVSSGAFPREVAVNSMGGSN